MKFKYFNIERNECRTWKASWLATNINLHVTDVVTTEQVISTVDRN